MVELKKLERIKDFDDSNKIIKTVSPKFNLSSEKHKQDSYQHKIQKINPKLKPHDYSKNKENKIMAVQKEKNTVPDNLENSLKLEIEKKRLQVISNKLTEHYEEITSNHLDNIVDKDAPNMDGLLDSLNKHLEKVEEELPFFESISFLGDQPKIEKIPIKSMNVSHLYAKIDSIANKEATPKVIQTEYLNQNKRPELKPKKIQALLEEIEIPEIVSIPDETKISQAIIKEFSSYEQKPVEKTPTAPIFVMEDKKVVPNPHIEIKIKNQKNIIQKSNQQAIKQKEEFSKVFKEQDQKPKTPFDYILPTDFKAKTEKERSESINPKSQSKMQELIYSIKPKTAILDRKEISEKYNIDEFTFVNLDYASNGLLYNIIQPELSKNQEETYKEIKRLFLDSIDSNYLSFKGDKQTINSYIQKIYDLTIDKLSYNLTDLENKLYFNFIKRDFSGFGFLSSVLEDKNIIEISCSGEHMPITVYHLLYGGLETNLKFESIAKLNQYVLSLTKIMGLQVNSTQPVINGYLPNGYKVEGLYSVGDTSNKGSSFVIKKYLEDPLTPVNLINLGIGAPDIFSYIWTAIDEDYQVVIVGGDSTLLLSALAHFYPDKKITTIQSFDYIKLPQKNWIKKLILDNSSISKKTILSQAISQRSDYLILDNFTEDLFDTKWYEINMLYLDKSILGEYLKKSKIMGFNKIIIQLGRTNSNNVEQMQIRNITEIYNGNKYNVVEYIEKEMDFHINLISSNISIVNFIRHKKLLRWLIDSGITDSLDFNNIVNDYYQNKEQLLTKLNIQAGVE